MGDKKKIGALQKEIKDKWDQLDELVAERAHQLGIKTAEISLALDDLGFSRSSLPPEFDPGAKLSRLHLQIRRLKKALKDEEKKKAIPT